MTQEEKYRKQAKVFLRRLNEAKQFFDNHKPSIGYVGEYLLRQSLLFLIPQSYGVCQGFVIYKKELSHYDNQENDYELNYGDQWFTVKEMEVFKISPK